MINKFNFYHKQKLIVKPSYKMLNIHQWEHNFENISVKRYLTVKYTIKKSKIN